MAEKPAISERDTVEVLRFLKEAPVIEIVLPKERRKQITPVHNERK